MFNQNSIFKSILLTCAFISFGLFHANGQYTFNGGFFIYQWFTQSNDWRHINYYWQLHS